MKENINFPPQIKTGPLQQIRLTRPPAKEKTKISFFHNNKKGLLWNINYFVILSSVVSPIGIYAQSELNRFTESRTFGEIVLKLAGALTIVALPFLVVFLIIAGFLFVTAQGNEQQLAKAKNTLFWTVIGAALIIGSWAIAIAVGRFGAGLGG